MAPTPGDRYDDAEEREQRVEMQVAVLHVRQAGGGAPPQRSEAVERTVEERPVAETEKDLLRYPDERPPDQRVVGFVDVVLAGKDAVQRREAQTRALCTLGSSTIHVRGRGEAGECEQDRRGDERGLVVLEGG